MTGAQYSRNPFTSDKFSPVVSRDPSEIEVQN